MTVYVDDAVFMKPNGRKKYAHMVATSYEELHEFAAKIGVKKHFFHRSSKYPHYDITEQQRLTAVEAGAVATSSKTVLEVAKSLL